MLIGDQSQPPTSVTFYISHFWTLTKPLLSGGGGRITINNPLEFLFSIGTTDVRVNRRQLPLCRARGKFFHCVWCLYSFSIQLFSAWQVRVLQNAGSSAEGKRIVRKGHSLWMEFSAEYRHPTLVPFIAESIICPPLPQFTFQRLLSLKAYKSMVSMHVRGFVLLDLPRALLTTSSTSPQTFSQGCFLPV